MSASERLAALDAATKDLLPTLNYYIGPGARTASSREQVAMYFATKAVLTALPEIVAVVRAAEEARENSMAGTRLRYAGSWVPVDPQAWLDLGAALAALDEKLADAG